MLQEPERPTPDLYPLVPLVNHPGRLHRVLERIGPECDVASFEIEDYREH